MYTSTHLSTEDIMDELANKIIADQDSLSDIDVPLFRACLLADRYHPQVGKSNLRRLSTNLSQGQLVLDTNKQVLLLTILIDHSILNMFS